MVIAAAPMAASSSSPAARQAPGCRAAARRLFPSNPACQNICRVILGKTATSPAAPATKPLALLPLNGGSGTAGVVVAILRPWRPSGPRRGCLTA